MIINYFGQNCFRVQSGEKTILIDPLNNRLKANFILRTIIPTNIVLSQESTTFIFAGEYEVGGINVCGFEAESTDKFIKTIFKIEWEDTSFVFLGPISKSPTSEFLEEITQTDILFIPASGKPFLKEEEAVKLIKIIEPKIIIPAFIDNKEPKEFFKFLGQKPKLEEKLVFRKKDILSKTKEIVWLEAKL